MLFRSPVYERYCTPEGRKRVRRDVEIFSFRRPIQKVAPGNTLRIIDADRFDLVWSTDDWKTIKSTTCRELGSAGFSADIPASFSPGQISWTLKWPEKDRWLGYNVTVEIVS